MVSSMCFNSVFVIGMNIWSGVKSSRKEFSVILVEWFEEL